MMNGIWPTANRICGARAAQRCAFDKAITTTIAPRLRSLSTWHGRTSSKSLLTNTTRSSLAATHTKSWIASRRSYATSNVVTDYDQIPPDYTDAKGLDFHDRRLTNAQLLEIFKGLPVDVTVANQSLRILHGRRVAGVLGEPSLRRVRLGKTKNPRDIAALEERALAWLRQHVPVDEINSEGRYAETELEKMMQAEEGATEEETIARAKKLGLVKEHNPSVVEQIKAMRDRERQEEAERAARGESEEDVVATSSGPLQKFESKKVAELRPRGEHPWLKKLEARARVLPDQPPEMSLLKRVLPSGILALLVVAGSVVFAYLYVPPARENRMWPDVPPAAATVLALIGANTAVFVAWHMPIFWRYLNKYFLMVPGYPRALSVIGNTFSHQKTSHFLVNMVMLWFMGTHLCDDIGRGNFLAVYFSTGVLASMTSLTYYAATRNFTTAGLGASGAITGVVGAYLWMHRDEFFKFFGLPPAPWQGVPGWVILVPLVLGELTLGRVVSPGNVDKMAHLGGYASGILAGEVLRRTFADRIAMRKKRAQDRERLLKKITEQ